MDSRLVLGILLVGGCKAELADAPTDGGNNFPGQDGSTTPTDGGGTDAPTMLGPWGTPARVPGADTAAAEDDVTMSSSRLELFFKRVDADSANLYVMSRATTTSAWSAPQPLTILNTNVDEESPRLSQDDLTLYFGRNGDIFRTTRAAVGGAWGMPTAVAPLNTSAYEKWAAVCPNGYTIVSRAVTDRGQDLFEGTISSGAPTALGVLNTTSVEQGTLLTSDCLRVYFQSNRSNNQFDIYVATRASLTSAWSNPTALPDFNTATFSEEDPWISTDQRTFAFASNSAGNKDLYLVTR